MKKKCIIIVIWESYIQQVGIGNRKFLVGHFKGNGQSGELVNLDWCTVASKSKRDTPDLKTTAVNWFAGVGYEPQKTVNSKKIKEVARKIKR